MHGAFEVHSIAFRFGCSRFESDTLGTMIIFNTSNGTDLVEYPFATIHLLTSRPYIAQG